MIQFLDSGDICGGTIPSTTTEPVEETTPSQAGKGSPLQLWLVAMAAIFGMIIVILAILCVSLRLKKNKKKETTDYFKRELKLKKYNPLMSTHCCIVADTTCRSHG